MLKKLSDEIGLASQHLGLNGNELDLFKEMNLIEADDSKEESEIEDIAVKVSVVEESEESEEDKDENEVEAAVPDNDMGSLEDLPMIVNRNNGARMGEDNPIKSISEVKSMQEIKKLSPIKSIQDVKSIQEVKSIKEVPRDIASRFIKVKCSDKNSFVILAVSRNIN